MRIENFEKWVISEVFSVARNEREIKGENRQSHICGFDGAAKYIEGWLQIFS